MVLGPYHNNQDYLYTFSSGNLLTAVDARTIDLKIDDGMPLTGNVYALFENRGEDNEIFYLAATPNLSGCVSTASGNSYNNGAANTCAITIKAGF